jgi:hypothetical protein
MTRQLQPVPDGYGTVTSYMNFCDAAEALGITVVPSAQR